MAFVGKVLADGQVSDTVGDLYTVPASTVAYVRSFSVWNTSSGTETVVVYVDTGGGARIVARAVLGANEGADIVEGGSSWVLHDGVKVQAETTTASTVDFVMTGVEQA